MTGVKATFELTVLAPEGWTVISNGVQTQLRNWSDNRCVWQFAPTPLISTYVTALVAGHYYEYKNVLHGCGGEVPMRVLCRQSMRPDLDGESITTVTQSGLSFFESMFDRAYPFEKYDQPFVPEFNFGVMENVACVVFRDDLLTADEGEAQLEQRTGVILHELAHMWFGDLVTMRWWDDLWLNEAFAEWACYTAMAGTGLYPQAWTGFAHTRGSTATAKTNYLPLARWRLMSQTWNQ